MFKPVPPLEGKAPTELPRVEPRQATYHITHWTRIRLWFWFFMGFLDRFETEDDFIVVEGFRDPVTKETWITDVYEVYD